jgi:pyruvate formate lyase activating enzyme
MMLEIKRHGLKLLAFTYNEPVVFYEFMLDVAREASEAGTISTMISNGYINQAPLSELLGYISAFNIDLKAFNNDFYRRMTGSELEPVLKTIKEISKASKHLELTFLVIPELNDDIENFQAMIDFIVNETGSDTVLHISRYFPRFKLNTPPTPLETIQQFTDIAKHKLRYVYAGNTGNSLDISTYCPDCNNLLINRSFYSSEIAGITQNVCNRCGLKIYGKF